MLVKNSSKNQINEGENQHGSSITSVYGVRKVKVYAVYEPELKHISLFNTASIALFSMASFFLAIATKNGFSINVFSDETFWFGITLLCMGAYAFWSKSSLISTIKKEPTENKNNESKEST